MAEVQEFFNMGGYAFFVWPSFGITLVVLLANVWISRWQYKRAVQETARRVASQANRTDKQ